MNWRARADPGAVDRCVSPWHRCVVARARYITDLSAFLPAKPTPAQQLLVDQLRDGPASRLILIAVEHGDADARARASVAMAARLRRDPRFSSVNNGEPLTAERDREFLFQHRYLLSDPVAAQRFSAAGLRAAIEDTIDDLASPGGTACSSRCCRTIPPARCCTSSINWHARPHRPAGDGVWVSADGARTLLVAQTAAGGSDTDAQEHAIEAIRAAFAAAAARIRRGQGASPCN